MTVHSFSTDSTQSNTEQFW